MGGYCTCEHELHVEMSAVNKLREVWGSLCVGSAVCSLVVQCAHNSVLTVKLIIMVIAI